MIEIVVDCLFSMKMAQVWIDRMRHLNQLSTTTTKKKSLPLNLRVLIDRAILTDWVINSIGTMLLPLQGYNHSELFYIQNSTNIRVLLMLFSLSLYRE